MSKWVNTGGAETGNSARRFDVVLPHKHCGDSNLQQSTAPQPRAGDHAAREEQRPAVEAAVRPLYVEGYTAQLSYCAGDKIDFCVSTSAPTFTLTVARIGAVCEDVFERSEIMGAAYDVPENAASHGCSWPSAFQLSVQPEWRTGYYEATLSVEDDGGADWTHRGRRTATSVMGFVVRTVEPGAATRILLQLATNTYAAYNNWGGHCLYGAFGQQQHQGTRVSFERPCAGLFHKWEHCFVHWAESSDYVMDYATNLDLEQRPEMLDNYSLVLSVGHDEYWSAGMRDSLESFIARGGNCAFFAGNAVCWCVRPEDDGRALTSFKQMFVMDPVWSTQWSHPLLQRPENRLTGVGFDWGGYHRAHGHVMEEYRDEVHGNVVQPGAYTVHRPDHWVFEGTKMAKGSSFGAEHSVVGYECDGCEWSLDKDGLPAPTCRDGTPASFQILCTAPAIWAPGDAWWREDWDQERVGSGCMGVYTNDAGGEVFTAGSTDWPHGLVGREVGEIPKAFVTFSSALRRSLDGTPDPTVDRIARNVLDRLSAKAPPSPCQGRLGKL